MTMGAAHCNFCLGIDLGTTAVKAVVLDGNASVVAFGTAPTRLITGVGGLVEQDVEDVWQNAVEAVRRALSGTSMGSAVRAVSLSSQGGTLILLDNARRPVTNAISWMDSRPARLGKELLQGRDDDFYYERTGWGIEFGGLPLAQLVRLRRESPDLMRGARHVRFVDCYAMERLTGRAVCNPSDAAIAMLYNVREGCWDDELLALAGIGREALPSVEPSGTVVGPLQKEAAMALGISARAVAVAGGHDQYCAAYGAGCRQAGDTIVSCGTAWVVLTMTRQPAFNREARLGPAKALTGDLWGLLGACPTAGACVDWLRRVVSPGDTPLAFDRLEAAAATVKPSADNPVFIPARGGDGGRVQLIGLAMHHEFGHVARAVLEGAAMSARALLLRMKAAGAGPSMLRAVGGATRSQFWMQILSDVTGLPLEVAGVQESAAFGAAMLAGKSTGVIAPEVGWPEPSLRVEPRPELRSVYDELFRKFTEGSA